MPVTSTIELESTPKLVYSSKSLFRWQKEQSNDLQKTTIINLVTSFFENENIEEIDVRSGQTFSNFELRIVWKSLNVFLNVTIEPYGKAIFEFIIPNESGVNWMVYSKDWIPVFDRLVNILNVKNTMSVASHVINFKRDTKKHHIKTIYTFNLYNDQFNELNNEKKLDILNSFKKLTYMVFSNSLLRIKANYHLFHYLIKYPKLSLSELLRRNETQLKTLFNPEINNESVKPRANLNSEEVKRERILAIVRDNNSKYVSISKVYIGVGGFGEVRYGRYTNKKTAIKFFKNPLTRSSSQDKNHMTRKSDSMRELIANIKLNAPWFPKFYGMAFQEKETSRPVFFSSFAKGEKLSRIYKEILEDDPEIIPQIIAELWAAIAYIHNRGIFHGDLSLNNVIVDFNKRTKKFKLTLIDFGMSGDPEIDSVSGLTVDFAAYEILLHSHQGTKKKLDIYSLGSIIFQLYYRISFIHYFVKMYNLSEENEKANQVRFLDCNSYD
jgi:hypothetical protein